MHLIMHVRVVTGEGDDAKAVEWLRRSVQKEHPASLYQLGLLAGSGRGMEKDVEQATKLMRLAAERGFAPAQYFLALTYIRGQGVPKDDAIATDPFSCLDCPSSTRLKNPVMKWSHKLRGISEVFPRDTSRTRIERQILRESQLQMNKLLLIVTTQKPTTH